MHPLLTTSCLAVLAAVAPWALAADIRVPDDAPGVQEAIDLASDGDRVIVAGGTWQGPFDLKGKSLLLKALSPGRTILHGAPFGGPVVLCVSGEGPGTVLEDLIIRGGRGQPVEGFPDLTVGGGLLCQGASPTLRRCVFDRNHASLSGGGAMCADGADARFESCTFSHNESEKGGALSAVGSDPALINCTFEANRATWSGGAVLVADGSEVTVEGGRFTRNVAGFTGGGVYEYDAQTSIEDTTFDRNRATLRGGAVYFGHRSSGEMERCHFKSPTDEVAGSNWARAVDAMRGACQLERWCVQAEESDCMLAGGIYLGDHSTCGGASVTEGHQIRGDVDRDGVVDDRDLALLMLLWR
ncbi:MAG: right-handed parallel beta-helix repeat-containing protein [Phycisphaerales bacterium]|nr:right-handed parallel beta-helix repeat-containing protein [Phycisphaerales bacterium]